MLSPGFIIYNRSSLYKVFGDNCPTFNEVILWHRDADTQIHKHIPTDSHTNTSITITSPCEINNHCSIAIHYNKNATWNIIFLLMRINPHKQIRVVYALTGIALKLRLFATVSSGKNNFISIAILRNSRWSRTVLHWWPWAVVTATVSISVVILHFHGQTLSIWPVPSRIHSGIHVYIYIYVLAYIIYTCWHIYIIYNIIINYILVEAWTQNYQMLSILNQFSYSIIYYFFTIVIILVLQCILFVTCVMIVPFVWVYLGATVWLEGIL